MYVTAKKNKKYGETGTAAKGFRRIIVLHPSMEPKKKQLSVIIGLNLDISNI